MTKKGFSLIELLVVISIIAILTSVAVVGLQNINKKAADTRRLSDLRRIQIAVETYRNVNNLYPEKGVQGSDNYILNLTPIYITTLPKDPSKNHTGNSGYIYNVSTDKKSFCFYIKDTVYKPESQKELQYDTTNSWRVCRGNLAATNSSTCTNGATNFPTCNNNVCTNGATNFPSCNNICTNAYINYPTCGPVGGGGTGDGGN